MTDQPFRALELQGQADRQAVPSITGTVYQTWASLEAWLNLTGDGAVIYLEGAEDFDRVSFDQSVAVQVKHERKNISLAQQPILSMLEHFWTLVNNNPDRPVQLHYLTTSSVSKESDLELAVPGIVAWNAARTSKQTAIQLAHYLTKKLVEGSPLKEFLRTADAKQLQESLFKPFSWLIEQPGLDTIKLRIAERVIELLDERNLPTIWADAVVCQLEAAVWNTLVKPDSHQRQLSRGLLLQVLEQATMMGRAVSTQQIGEFLQSLDCSPLIRNPVDTWKISVPMPPKDLLDRDAFMVALANSVERSASVLLTGTVHKGKTTIAQMLAMDSHPEALWFSLTEVDSGARGSLLRELERRVLANESTPLIILDDIDASAGQLSSTIAPLERLLTAAKALGVSILLTSRGRLDSIDKDRLVTVEVPAMTKTEIEKHTLAYGCSAEHVSTWSMVIRIRTMGHPKLVQVQLLELRKQGWPAPILDDVTRPSQAVRNAKKIARQLLSDTQSPAVAEFLYVASELCIPMTLELAIAIADSVEGLRNAGDIVDQLSGEWLERRIGDVLTVTPLLNGSAADVWPADRYQSVHQRLHDLIGRVTTMDQYQAAARLFHAFMSGDERRMGASAYMLLYLHVTDTTVAETVYRELTWLLAYGNEASGCIAQDPDVEVNLRALQFSVAQVLESAQRDWVAQRWVDAVAGISAGSHRATYEYVMLMTIGLKPSTGLKLKTRLNVVSGLIRLDHQGGWPDYIEQVDRQISLPNAEVLPHWQIALAMTAHMVNELDALAEFTQWITDIPDNGVQQEVDAFLLTDLAQNLGAFVQMPWVSARDTVTDWAPWLTAYQTLFDEACQLGLPNLSHEAAKALSIILCEYSDDAANALAILDQAESAMGSSIVLTEQRANVYYNTHDDEAMIMLWDNQWTPHRLSVDTLDPFACRRFAVALSRLKRYKEAGELFFKISASIEPGTLDQTRFALMVDAAIAAIHDGNVRLAVKILFDAVRALPTAAAEDGDGHWEVVQRFAHTAIGEAERRWKTPRVISVQVTPGAASDPHRGSDAASDGQSVRTEYLLLSTIGLAASLAVCRGASDMLRLIAPMSPLALHGQLVKIEAKLACLLCEGSVSGVVSGVIELNDRMQAMHSKNRINDQQTDSNSRILPERWQGLLCAALFCSPMPMSDSLQVMRIEAGVQSDSSTKLLAAITSSMQILKLTHSERQKIVYRQRSLSLSRFVAVIEELETPQSVQTMVELQQLIAVHMFMDNSTVEQSLFNYHLTRQLASLWRQWLSTQSESCLTTFPVHAVEQVCDAAESGSLTLKGYFERLQDETSQPTKAITALCW